MGWQREQWTQTYQSRFGRKEWLKPYTDDVLMELAKKGMKRVYVALPGFTADCLETLDEIGRESKEVFENAGGEHLKNGTCLNDHPKWIDAMARIVRDEGAGVVQVDWAFSSLMNSRIQAGLSCHVRLVTRLPLTTTSRLT